MKNFKIVVFVIMIMTLVVGGCSPQYDINKYSIELNWKNSGGSEASSVNLLSIEMDKKYTEVNTPFIITTITVKAILRDENGDIVPDAIFDYVFSEHPTHSISEKTNESVTVSFGEAGKGTIITTTVIDSESIQATLEYKVYPIADMVKVDGVTELFDFETASNVENGGDLEFKNNILNAPYGFTKIPSEQILMYEALDSLKDISGYDYSSEGAIWGEEDENVWDFIYFIRTKNGGYVKFQIAGIGITWTKPSCSVMYEYSPDGIFE